MGLLLSKTPRRPLEIPSLRKFDSSKWRPGSRRVPIIVSLVRVPGSNSPDRSFPRRWYLRRVGGPPKDREDHLGCARNPHRCGSARVIDGQRRRRPLVKGARLAAVSRARVHSVGGRHVSHADVRMHHLYPRFSHFSGPVVS